MFARFKIENIGEFLAVFNLAKEWIKNEKRFSFRSEWFDLGEAFQAERNFAGKDFTPEEFKKGFLSLCDNNIDLFGQYEFYLTFATYKEN